MFDLLHPSQTFFYMNEVPKVDGWKNTYEYWGTGSLLKSQVIEITSFGRNKTADQWPANNITIGPFVPTDYDQDILWVDGFFVRWPGGLTN
jgi:hypothetical protein